MEIKKSNIHMNQIKDSINTQISLEDDFIIPETYPDINYIIADDSSIYLDNVKVLDGKIILKGSLSFRILYSNDETGALNKFDSEILVDEVLYTDVIKEDDSINFSCDIEDLSAVLINSRKISIRAIVAINISSESIFDIETTSDISGENIYFEKESVKIIQLTECKKDILRLKTSIEIPSNSPNIDNILWDITRIKNLDVRLDDNALNLSGNLSTCVIYEEENTGHSKWLEETIPFSGSLNLSGCNDELVPDIIVNLQSKNITLKTNSDGEARILEYDMAFGLNIKLYKEMELSYLNDVYSTKCELIPTRKHVKYNNLIMKNISKCKISDRLKLSNSHGKILQICGNEGEIKIEETKIMDNCIHVEGVIIINLLYISTNDTIPVDIVKEVVPFSQNIEVYNITSDALIYIRPALEQLSCNMSSSNEVEVKATASLDTLVLGTLDADIITSITEEPLSNDTLKEIPSIMGYLVKNGDSLFSIAKQFYSTTEDIISINDINGNQVTPGEMLLIVNNANVII